jgi:FMN phosphatase YigB (HAD superfamily)
MRVGRRVSRVMSKGRRCPLFRPHTVTFDCWSTLMHQGSRSSASPTRAQIVAHATGVTEERAAAAFRAAWRRQQMLWHRREILTGADVVRQTLQILGASLGPEPVRELIDAVESHALSREIRTANGATEFLERLARAGVRRALVCDTGCTPGRVVRSLLDRAGLLRWLEVTIFSDEIGCPKPHPRTFEAALKQLGVSAEGAVHVGDLRRTDIAGAHGCGMGAVRVTVFHDDGDVQVAGDAGGIGCADAGCDPFCERPEADAVVESFAALTARLGF